MQAALSKPGRRVKLSRLAGLKPQAWAGHKLALLAAQARLIALVAAFALWAPAAALAQAAAPSPGAPAAAVQVLPVLPGPSLARMERQEIRAQLTPRRYTMISAEIGARIQRLPVAEAEAFKAGDLLVEFDCNVPQAQRRKAQAELEAAQATHRSNEQLLKLNSIGPLEFELSRAGVSRGQAEVGTHDAILEKCRIAAPFTGRVAEQKVREQQFVQPGQALLDILDDTSLELEFLVPSNWLRWLKIGLPLRVSIDETRKTYPARFTRIGAKVDPVSQSIKVAATIEGNPAELVAGMSGRVMAAPPP